MWWSSPNHEVAFFNEIIHRKTCRRPYVWHKWRVIIRWFKIFVFCWSFHENKVLVKYDIYKAVSSVSELCQKYTTSYTLDILHRWYITSINVLLYRNISAITFGLWWKFHVDMLLAVMVIIRFGIWPFLGIWPFKRFGRVQQL